MLSSGVDSDTATADAVALLGAVVDQVTALASLEGPEIEGLSRSELGIVVRDVAGIEARLACLRARVVAEAEARDIADEQADTGTAAWLARQTRQTRADAMATAGFAAVLKRYPAVQEAMQAGRVGEAQARIVVRAADRLPAALSVEERARCGRPLVAKAEVLSPSGLRKAARRMLEAVEPGSRKVDKHEGDELEKDEARAEEATWLMLHDNGDDTYGGRFRIPELHGQMLATILECLTAPRRREGAREVDPTTPAWPGLSWCERLGQGFLELIEHLPTDGLPTGVSATVVVHVDLDSLREAVGAAGLDAGGRISAQEARRLACSAGLVPMVLGGDSVPLDLGRRRRLFSPAQRLALSARYGTCAAVGCERPFAWCELHHLRPWSEGGRTDLDQAVPLCGHHHRRVHDHRYRHRLRPDGSLTFEVVRPDRWAAAA